MTGRMVPADHADCPEYLRGKAAARGVEVTVSTAPPLVVGPYTVDPFVCPHGTRFYVEPTGEQIARWARDGVQ